MDIVSYIIIALLFSAFFSGMETAFVSSNKLRMQLQKQTQNIASSILDIFYTNEKQFVSTMLVGSYISLVAYGLFFSTLFADWTYTLGIYLNIILQLLIATAILLITSRFLPKAIFKINSNLWLRLFSPVLLFFYIILYPIAWIGSTLSLRFLKILKVDIPEKTEENIFSKININYLLQDNAENKDSLKEIEKDVRIFQNALDFSSVKLRDCLIPRTEIVSLDFNATTVNILKQTFIETGLSKIVIYKEDIDNIVGYIHATEMFQHQKDWKKHIKQIPIVPENMAAQRLMKIFMQQKKSIAVVVDEFGGTAGIVTLEDIMEQIFGDIEDEHDVKGHKAEKIGENEYLFEGRVEVEEANQLFDLSLPLSDAYTTIAGYILHVHQHFPKLNEVIHIDNYTFKCVKVTNNRIELVKMVINS